MGDGVLNTNGHPVPPALGREAARCASSQVKILTRFFPRNVGVGITLPSGQASGAGTQSFGVRQGKRQRPPETQRLATDVPARGVSHSCCGTPAWQKGLSGLSIRLRRSPCHLLASSPSMSPQMSFAHPDQTPPSLGPLIPSTLPPTAALPKHFSDFGAF